MIDIFMLAIIVYWHLPWTKDVFAVPAVASTWDISPEILFLPGKLPHRGHQVSTDHQEAKLPPRFLDIFLGQHQHKE